MDAGAVTSPLTREQQDLVRGEAKTIEAVVRTLSARVAKWIAHDDVAGIVRTTYAECAKRFDPQRGPFSPFARFLAEAAVIDAVRREAKNERFKWAMAAASREHLSSCVDTIDVLKDTEEDTTAHRRRWYNVHLAAMMVAKLAEIERKQSEDGVIDRESYGRAMDALRAEKAKLRERERQLLKLHYDEKKKLEDVAAELGVSYSTARNVHRAVLERLMVALRAQGVTSPPPFEGGGR